MDFIFKPFMFTNDLVEESVEVVVNAGDLPWPTDAILCVPPLATQVTLHEQAECLATQAFLRMHGLKFVLDERQNAEFMSVSSKLPLLKIENHFVAGFDAITAYARLRIRRQLTNEQEGEIRPYVELIQITVKNAEIKTYLMESSALRSVEDVRESLLKDLRALSERLGPRPYFLDDVHTNELDALAFGHLSALLTCHLPEGNLSELIQRHQNLVAFCQRIDRLFFAKELGLNTELYNTTVVTGMRRLPPMMIKSDI